MSWSIEQDELAYAVGQMARAAGLKLETVSASLPQSVRDAAARGWSGDEWQNEPEEHMSLAKKLGWCMRPLGSPQEQSPFPDSARTAEWEDGWERSEEEEFYRHADHPDLKYLEGLLDAVPEFRQHYRWHLCNNLQVLFGTVIEEFYDFVVDTYYRVHPEERPRRRGLLPRLMAFLGQSRAKEVEEPLSPTEAERLRDVLRRATSFIDRSLEDHEESHLHCCGPQEREDVVLECRRRYLETPDGERGASGRES